MKAQGLMASRSPRTPGAMCRHILTLDLGSPSTRDLHVLQMWSVEMNSEFSLAARDFLFL